jgi:hypothetical protein
MSTRSVIARATKTGFAGVYHHWDGYPEGLGATLFAAFNGHFNKDLGKMLRYLINEHPAGWSSIADADFAAPAGFQEGGFKSAGPQCYCHGGRHEPANRLTHKNASGCGCEWAYVFSAPSGDPTLEVYSAYHRDGNKAIGWFGCGDEKAQWRRCATIRLLAPAPDWKAVQEGGEITQRPVVNFV